MAWLGGPEYRFGGPECAPMKEAHSFMHVQRAHGRCGAVAGLRAAVKRLADCDCQCHYVVAGGGHFGDEVAVPRTLSAITLSAKRI